MTTQELEAVRAVPVVAILRAHGIEPDRRGFVRCPFHAGGREKTPSMKVYADGVHCYACGKHLDGIGLEMALTGASFPDACGTIAARAGIRLSGRRDDGGTRLHALAVRSERERERAVRAAFGRWREDALCRIERTLGLADHALNQGSPSMWTDAQIEAVKARPELVELARDLDSGDEAAWIRTFQERDRIDALTAAARDPP